MMEVADSWHPSRLHELHLGNAALPAFRNNIPIEPLLDS
jgi:hypothetical protein